MQSIFTWRGVLDRAASKRDACRWPRKGARAVLSEAAIALKRASASSANRPGLSGVISSQVSSPPDPELAGQSLPGSTLSCRSAREARTVSRRQCSTLFERCKMRVLLIKSDLCGLVTPALSSECQSNMRSRTRMRCTTVPVSQIVATAEKPNSKCKSPAH